MSQLVDQVSSRNDRRSLVSELKTRGYELDQDSLIPPHTLLRYLEQMRWEANESALADLPRLFEQDHFAVVAAQKLVVNQDIGFNVELYGTTSVARVGRTSLDFFHGLYRAGEEEPVTVGLVTGVYMGPNGKPAPLPDEIRGVVIPCQREAYAFPDPSGARPTEDAWRHAFEVRPSDQDLLRHVNHANYLAFFDDARHLGAAAGGFGEYSRAAAGRLRAAAIEYRKQAVAGDGLVALVWLLSESPLELGAELQRVDDHEPICSARLCIRT